MQFQDKVSVLKK